MTSMVAASLCIRLEDMVMVSKPVVTGEGLEVASNHPLRIKTKTVPERLSGAANRR